MVIHLVDGTYELFRSFFALPPLTAPDGRPAGAVLGIIQSLLLLLRECEVTHVGCAFDHTIESFRNGIFPGYKSGAGVPPDLLAQFELAERAVGALGIICWPMAEFEADDAIATAVAQLRQVPAVDRIVICSPDKDMAQLVEGDRIVEFDRRRGDVLNEQGVIGKFGVAPASIPDLLALAGDSADGIPGLPRWGAKISAQVLARYRHIEDIPGDPGDWDVLVRGSRGLSKILTEYADEARLYKDLATLRTDVPLDASVELLEWKGVVKKDYLALCEELAFTRLTDLPHRWAPA